MGVQIVCTRRAVPKSEFSCPRIEFDGAGELWTYIVANRPSICASQWCGNAGDAGEIGAASVSVARRYSMVAHYADHAANERTFLAWIGIGLPVVAFGFFSSG
jgi:hypothetical protein